MTFRMFLSLMAFATILALVALPQTPRPKQIAWTAHAVWGLPHDLVGVAR
jgi:hypothetical protein